MERAKFPREIRSRREGTSNGRAVRSVQIKYTSDNEFLVDVKRRYVLYIPVQIDRLYNAGKKLFFISV